MKVIPIACLKDNYAYLLVDEASGEAGVVDPSEAPPVEAALQQAGVRLTAILNTHHHWDHTGGNKALLAAHPGLKVYGYESDQGRIEGQTEFLKHGQEFTLGRLRVRALHNPGHTSGAVSYVVEDAVFTGDTLFAGGCGRLFEGTPADMHKSLCETIGGLPRATRVFFGHEYTENNLRFAAAVEPHNAALQARAAQVRAQRGAGAFTTPSTLEEEWATNPFMRSGSPAVQQYVRATGQADDLSPVAVLAVLRRSKDTFGVGAGVGAGPAAR